VLAGACRDVDIYLRDNILDTGEMVPSPSGDWDPTTPNARVRHWQSADIKIDAPPYQPVDSLVDGVEFDNVTHRLLPFGYRIETVVGLTDESPLRANVNRVYVQAHNRGPLSATSVDVRLLWTDAAAGLPPLPADFWTGFATDSYSQAVWRLIGKKPIATLRPGRPHVVQFDWTPPAGVSDHVCLVAMVDSPDDSLLPEVELNVDTLTRANKRVTQKNVHPVSPVAVGGAWIALASLRLNNAFAGRRPFTCRLEALAPAGWTLTMVLPQVELQGPVDESLTGMRRRDVDRAQLEGWLAQAESAGAVSATLRALRPQFDPPLILEVQTLAVAAEVRGVLITPEVPVSALLVATQPRRASAEPLRFDVLQLADGETIGGSTFLVSAARDGARGPER